MTVELAAAIRQVVVAGHRHGGRWLVVGRDDVAAGWVFLLRVDAEGIETKLLCLCAAAVENERRVDPIGTDRQLRCRPPTDIAAGVGPYQIEPW
ncbi:hypothetical protein D3C80_1618520 [compost metagenome]